VSPGSPQIRSARFWCWIAEPDLTPSEREGPLAAIRLWSSLKPSPGGRFDSERREGSRRNTVRVPRFPTAEGAGEAGEGSADCRSEKAATDRPCNLQKRRVLPPSEQEGGLTSDTASDPALPRQRYWFESCVPLACHCALIMVSFHGRVLCISSKNFAIG